MTINMTMTADPPAATSASARERDDRLTRETARLRRRASVPIDRWFQLGGGILMGLGVLAILAGWYGVSHTARTWRQTPYLVSGGFFGLGLVFIGGFAYFAYWMTRLAEQSHRQTAVLERIERALVGAAAGSQGSGDGDALVVVGDVVHRANCVLVAGRADAASVAEGASLPAGARPCPMCEPPIG